MAQANTSRRSARVAIDCGELAVDMILIAEDEDHFLLQGDGAARCPGIVLRPCSSSDDLGTVVENAVSDQLAVRTEYLGILAAGDNDSEQRLVISAMVKDNAATGHGHQGLRWYSYPEILRVASSSSAHLFADTASMRRAKASTGLEPAIQRSFAMAVDYLSKHVSVEGDLKGWDQYQDGIAIGVLSTAQGLLCHIHAGARGSLVDDAASTLERLQNPDGGWRVRRALVGEQSEISITESTCYCLWALQASGRSGLSQSVRMAMAWLERTQGADGGWRSSARVVETQVGPTAAAVAVLSRCARTDSVRRGSDWLRSVQCHDGGWGPTAPPSPRPPDFASPAYTAHVIIALLESGVPADDPAIDRGCKFLETTFDGSRSEPWRPTSFTTIVDTNTSARLDFRYFATPWVIAALCKARRITGNPAILRGIKHLLALQDSEGAWRCELTAPNARPIWATHDALYALRVMMATGEKELYAAIMAPYLAAEQRVLGQALVRLISRQRRATASTSPGTRISARRWMRMIWLSLPTTVVAVIVLQQFGIFRLSGITAHRIAGALITAVVAFAGATLPHIVAEEYGIRRTRHEAERKGDEQ